MTDRGWSNKKFSLSSSPKSNIITKEYFAMIHTILDTDLYKFTTSYAYIKLFPYAMGTFSFKDRDDTAYTDTFLKELQEAVDSLAQRSEEPATAVSCRGSIGSGSPPSASSRRR